MTNQRCRTALLQVAAGENDERRGQRCEFRSCGGRNAFRAWIMTATGRPCVETVLALIRGEHPRNVVNPEIYMR